MLHVLEVQASSGVYDPASWRPTEPRLQLVGGNWWHNRMSSFAIVVVQGINTRGHSDSLLHFSTVSEP